MSSNLFKLRPLISKITTRSITAVSTSSSSFPSAYRARPTLSSVIAPSFSECKFQNIKSSSVFLTKSYSTSNPVPQDSDVDSISTDEYHKLSDEVLESILITFEELCESIPDLDVELSQGVLNLHLPPLGDYVINKQPPNKQIWWSSPLSGPKRFDIVNGVWTSLRDGSTLIDALNEETKIVTDKRNLPVVEFDF